MLIQDTSGYALWAPFWAKFIGCVILSTTKIEQMVNSAYTHTASETHKEL